MARKICFIGWADHVHLERWAGYFAQQGMDVSVISFTGRGHYPPGVRQFEVGLKGRGPRWIAWRLRYLLWRIQPDLVHVHWAHFAVPARAAWTGPLVVTAWGSDIYRRDQFSDTDWDNLGAVLRSADLVTCDSEDLAASIREAFSVAATRVEVIQWGVDTDQFTPDGADLRSALGLGDRRVVLSVRNFTPLYNQETVVKAFALLKQRLPDTCLLMKSYGGDPAYIEKIRALIAELHLTGDVQILDSMPYAEMPALYRTADVTVSVPLSDATPMSLFEAMACGSPCVVCDLPSLREWVAHQQTGYLVAPTDVDAIVQALEQALTPGAPRESMRAAARQLMLDKASQKHHMGTAARHYDALADKRKQATA